MDTTLYYNELLGFYHSFDWMWIWDPNSQQLYQQVALGQYQPVQSQQSDPYAPQYPQYPQYPQTPQPYPQPQPQPPAPPAYVQPPRVGITYAAPRTTQTQAPAARPAPVVAPPAPASSQPTGQVQTAPPPRIGAASRATGGTVRMKNEPDPKQGYWEAFNLIGYWNEFGDSKYFYQGSYPVNKVRLTDGRPWMYGALAIYEGRDSKAGIYFLMYDSANENYEPPWKSAGDRVRAVQVRPVLPF